jgi:hypothetical protein
MASIIKANQLQDFGGNSILTSDGAGNLTTQKINYPAFEAYSSTNQTLADNVAEKVVFDTEKFDTDNCYDNSTNYRFTPTVAGKYLFFVSVRGSTASTQLRDMYIQLYKNGASLNNFYNEFTANYIKDFTPGFVTIEEANGTTDYFEIYARIDTNDSSDATLTADQTTNHFGAYRIGS